MAALDPDSPMPGCGRSWSACWGRWRRSHSGCHCCGCWGSSPSGPGTELQRTSNPHVSLHFLSWTFKFLILLLLNNTVFSCIYFFFLNTFLMIIKCPILSGGSLPLFRDEGLPVLSRDPGTGCCFWASLPGVICFLLCRRLFSWCAVRARATLPSAVAKSTFFRFGDSLSWEKTDYRGVKGKDRTFSLFNRWSPSELTSKVFTVSAMYAVKFVFVVRDVKQATCKTLC